MHMCAESINKQNSALALLQLTVWLGETVNEISTKAKTNWEKRGSVHW